MADREGLLDQFCRLTGAPRDRGRFFLEASSWKLQVTKYSSLYVCVCVCVCVVWFVSQSWSSCYPICAHPSPCASLIGSNGFILRQFWGRGCNYPAAGSWPLIGQNYRRFKIMWILFVFALKCQRACFFLVICHVAWRSRQPTGPRPPPSTLQVWASTNSRSEPSRRIGTRRTFLLAVQNAGKNTTVTSQLCACG